MKMVSVYVCVRKKVERERERSSIEGKRMSEEGNSEPKVMFLALLSLSITLNHGHFKVTNTKTPLTIAIMIVNVTIMM